MRGKFREGGRLGRWRDQIRGGLGNSQDHGVAVGDKDIAHAVRAWTSRAQYKTAFEERMVGVGDLDFRFRRVVLRWVVDRGIKIFDRLIIWTTRTSCRSLVPSQAGKASVNGSRQGIWTRMVGILPTPGPRKGVRSAPCC